MGAALPRHPIRAHPYEGNCERTSSSLHGCLGVTNRIPFHGRGTTLPSLNKVQNASDRNVIKFPIANGVGMVRGDQRVAKKCYSTSMKSGRQHHMDELDMRDEVRHPTYALGRTRTDTTRRSAGTPRLHRIEIGQRR